jgi:hypothetical protein
MNRFYLQSVIGDRQSKRQRSSMNRIDHRDIASTIRAPHRPTGHRIDDHASRRTWAHPPFGRWLPRHIDEGMLSPRGLR